MEINKEEFFYYLDREYKKLELIFKNIKFLDNSSKISLYLIIKI